MVKGYLVQTCLVHVPVRAEGTGMTVSFTSQARGLCYSCPPVQSSLPRVPVARSPNGSLIQHQTGPQGVQDLAVGYLTGIGP